MGIGVDYTAVALTPLLAEFPTEEPEFGVAAYSVSRIASSEPRSAAVTGERSA